MKGLTKKDGSRLSQGGTHKVDGNGQLDQYLLDRAWKSDEKDEAVLKMQSLVFREE
jgi:hypothetical protein